ncbi:uncharacterized protein Z518_09742 [Rhinocladiella mackenziei CBS 650.93]|uniref:Chromatin remodeling complex subunit (Chd3) n=1 Tax=Rhinocladiella mackenziei CBS 650.93 TaxID=1442369 RepID=A0A0D2FF82_9EURO|nr:uncharacterized protein Z518_09742 [Rhinocladiella mackenziei CBS 650.93]KIX00677.1 hypothetical protein Z518_09742 [Rhinocladiella mackenziei CBS 650.93]
MDGIDLSAWMGKAPEKLKEPMEAVETTSSQQSDSLDQRSDFSGWDGSNNGSDIVHDEGNVTNRVDRGETVCSRESSWDKQGNSVAIAIPHLKQDLYVDVPKLSEEEKDEYECLPGHFSAEKVLSQLQNNRYVVELGSGERDFVSERELCDLDNGAQALRDFKKKSMSRERRRTSHKVSVSGMVDWSNISISGSEDDTASRQKGERIEDSDASEHEAMGMSSGLEEDDISDVLQVQGRRSARLTRKRKSASFKQEFLGLDDDFDVRQRGRRPRIPTLRPTRDSARLRKLRPRALSSSPASEIATRRSGRTMAKPRRDMRVRQEDEIPSYEEEKTGPKIIGTKEYFAPLPDNDPFRKRHRQECDTCYFKGDDPGKGPLVFCQGCTNSYHKSCLGFRGTRDHLVTKVGENLFVLQCRRCIGLAHERDKSAPHHGLCVGCSEHGELSKPLRSRLTPRQEQLRREENGGKDPITIVEAKMINNTANVMFRCSQCARAWHMYHLPARKTAHSNLEDEEEEEMLGEVQLSQARFDHYHRSWLCKNCIENQSQIDTLVAWRPVDLEAYVPGTPVNEMQEEEKEYLVKWRAQSYFRTTWMPGTWVWGIAAGTTRSAFVKKPENLLPKMTTEDAIPEDVFRVDIVFDVRYSSVIRNSTKEIDLARVREVDSAFVKYKGLGYEDAIWEKPPAYADAGRWNDFKAAYEDYVMKLHLSIPPQAQLKRHLQRVRKQDFQSTLMKKEQPSSMTGKDKMMMYQMEGLNWLLFQWSTNQNVILADEMGLGKTIQIIAFFAALVQDHKCWPFLVVVPNSTCPNWRREIKRWAPFLRAVTYYGSSTARRLTHDYELFPASKDGDQHRQPKKHKSEVTDIQAHVVIASYESIGDDQTRQSLLKVPWQGLIVDEGQRLKSDRTQIYENLSKFKFLFKVLLTGTPLQNNARELFNLLQFLDKSMNAAELEAKYANLTQENVPELHEMLRKFFLRRTKAQVLTFLPPMAQIIVPVRMSTVQKKLYKSILAMNPQLMRSIFVRDGNLLARERVSLNNILMQLRKTLCHPFVYSSEIEEKSVESAVSHQTLVEASGKLQLLSIMLPKLQERGHRVLMFSQFLGNLDIIEDFLDGLGFRHRRLDGNISAMEKQKRIDEFNAPDSPYFAFLLSTRAGGVGINLATADTVIILDPDFNPHQDIQALSRAHRIGQKQKVVVFQLMTRNSAEEKIMQLGRKKMALDHVLIERMDKGDDAGEDLESILRHGAQTLFEDDSSTDDIHYDSASVDRLLDRSQIEDTSASEAKSAESQFSLARIWANDKASLGEDLPDGTGANTLNPGVWDKILQEREREYEEEQAREADTFGRGKRKRQNVDYGVGDGEKVDRDLATKGKRGPKKFDPDYEQPKGASEDDESTENEDWEAQPQQAVQDRVKSNPLKSNPLKFSPLKSCPKGRRN